MCHHPSFTDTLNSIQWQSFWLRVKSSFSRAQMSSSLSALSRNRRRMRRSENLGLEVGMQYFQSIALEINQLITGWHPTARHLEKCSQVIYLKKKKSELEDNQKTLPQRPYPSFPTFLLPFCLGVCFILYLKSIFLSIMFLLGSLPIYQKIFQYQDFQRFYFKGQ